MTKDKAEKIINKINNLEKCFLKVEMQNDEVSEGLTRIREQLYKYF